MRRRGYVLAASALLVLPTMANGASGPDAQQRYDEVRASLPPEVLQKIDSGERPPVVSETLPSGAPMLVDGKPAESLPGFKRGRMVTVTLGASDQVRVPASVKAAMARARTSAGRSRKKSAHAYVCYPDRVQAAAVGFGITWGKIWNHTQWCADNTNKVIRQINHHTDSYSGPAWCTSVVRSNWAWLTHPMSARTYSTGKVRNVTPWGCSGGDQDIHADISINWFGGWSGVAY